MSNSVCTQNRAQEGMNRIFTWIQNPTCTRLISNLHQLPPSNTSPWKPRRRFMDWALHKKNMQEGFASYFVDSVHEGTPLHEKKEGVYIRCPTLIFPHPQEGIPIHPDATIIHEQEEKIIEFCCQPERKGNTNQYAIHKARLKAAIYSYAQNPQHPCTTAFIVLHRWTKLSIHLQNIEHELNHIHESINKTIDSSIPYHFSPSCRWFCPHYSQCHTQATKAGNPLAWSSSLQNILHEDVWKAQTELSKSGTSHLHTIASFYTQAFLEDS